MVVSASAPSPEQVEAFVTNPRETAYEDLINELLDNPYYGERWGRHWRHWLDLTRYSDSDVLERTSLLGAVDVRLSVVAV